MSETATNSPYYEQARSLMEDMVETSQWPGEDNQAFVDRLGPQLEMFGFTVSTVKDPEQAGKALLVAEVGPSEGRQAMVAISHSDVVGVEGQKWNHDPATLREEDGQWFGRGVCDTHGSGVAMLLAARTPEIIDQLEATGQKLTIIFTYDEEATSPELSMRGARLAAGLLGSDPVVTAPYFIAGEPTEIEGRMVPMRSHKGRWLAHFHTQVEHPGHVSDNVQNALTTGANVVSQIGQYAKILCYGSSTDEDAAIYQPAHSTVQVSAAEVKSGDFSATPSTARFTVDMRTLPDVHDLRVREITDLITSQVLIDGETIDLEVIKDAPGSVTEADSPIVRLAEQVTGQAARGFNGGDEGRILRLAARKEGITLGPGELRYAHMPNEQISIGSVTGAIKVYAELFRRVVSLN